MSGSFYDPDNFTDPVQIAYERKHRILQPVWDFIINGREDALRSPLFPPFLAVSFYFSVIAIFTVFDMAGKNWQWIQKYKIQKNKEVTWPLIWQAQVNQLWNLVLWIIPMALVQLIWVPPAPLPPVAPTLFSFIWQQVAFFFVFDAEYWAWHALHHKVRFLYRWCHSIHHQYHSPFAAATQYLHPWELLFVGGGITMTPWLFKPHIMTYWCWFLIANYVSIEVHCGYKFPWAAHNWIPLYGGAPKHDMHHMRPLSNFEPWLDHLDRLLGWSMTEKQLEEYKAKRRADVGLHSLQDEIGLRKIN
jgi:cholesterol 25-hydroxylase